MKHIIKVNDIKDAKDNPVRPIVALDKNGVLFVDHINKDNPFYVPNNSTPIIFKDNNKEEQR